MATQAGSRLLLFSPIHVTLATAIGGPLAGAVVIAMNYRLLARTGAGTIAILLGALATVALLVAGWLLPKDFSPLVIVAGYTGVVYLVATRIQRPSLEAHPPAASRTQLAWRAVLVGLSSLALIAFILFVAFLVLPDNWLPRE